MDENIKQISAWLGTGSVNIFGRPFAGKDTQGEVLAELFGGILVAGGDILRHYHDQDKLQEIMATGALIPSDMFLDIVLPFFSKPDFKDKPLILSSIGRLHGEEPTILEAAESSGHPVKAAIFLTLSSDEVLQRFDESQKTHDRGDRADDDRQALQTRLQEFDEKTVPVVEYYREKGLLLEVDGTLSREDVTKAIIDSLSKLAQG